jgi:hypothetical protein
MEDLEYLRNLDKEELIGILKEEGIVVGSVIMNSQKFVKRCHQLGFGF